MTPKTCTHSCVYIWGALLAALHPLLFFGFWLLGLSGWEAWEWSRRPAAEASVSVPAGITHDLPT